MHHCHNGEYTGYGKTHVHVQPWIKCCCIKDIEMLILCVLCVNLCVNTCIYMCVSQCERGNGGMHVHFCIVSSFYVRSYVCCVRMVWEQ